MTEDSSDTLHLYIPDDEVQSAEHDAFGHLHIADAIVHSILNTSPPFIIGIFGGWGTGKSSILNLVSTQLSTKDVATVTIDAWQYSSADDLKRAFLVRIARELDPSLLDELLARLYTTEQEKLPPRPSRSDESGFRNFFEGVWKLLGYIFRTFFTFLIFSTLFFLLLALVFAIRSLMVGDPGANFNIIEVFDTFIDLAYVPLVVALIGQLKPLITQEPIIVQRERIDANELFAEYFNKAVTKATQRKFKKNRRLVIFIDNLDRLSKNNMVLALEALKTYLGNNNCIFVVACDDHVVRVVVEGSDLVPGVKNKINGNSEKRRLGEDYLDKFFQQTFRLPAYMEVDLSDFAESQFSRTHLHSILHGAGVDIGYLISTILPSDATSPRKVKRLLNEFIATYEVARRLEQETTGRLRPLVLTGDPVFLGKFSTLRAEYPEFYSELVASPGILNKITAYLRSLEDNKAIEVIGSTLPSSKVESLVGYLRKTIHVIVADIDPYIWLCQDSLSRGLAADKARDLRIALSDGDHRKAIEMLEEADSHDEKDLLGKVAWRYVGLRLRGLNQQNGTLVLCRIIDHVSVSIQSDVAQAAANLIPRFPLRGFQASDILPVLQKAKRSEKGDLVNELLKRLDESDLRQETFDAILKYSDVIEEAGATILVQNWLTEQFTTEGDE